MHDGTSRFTDLNGETIYHFLFVSSFSEYTVLHVANVVKLQTSIPPNRACLLSCGVPTGVGAAWKTANVEPGSTVAIFGLGSIGLAVAEGARLCGASRIIGIDVNSDKFEIAKGFGVSEFIDPNNSGNKRVSEIMNEITDGGADYCFECVGKSSLVEEAYACCRCWEVWWAPQRKMPRNNDRESGTHGGWGKTIVLGVGKPGATLSFSSFEVLHLGRTLMGSFFGGIKPKRDVPVLITPYIGKELELDKFVTHEVGLEEINKAFDLLLEGKSLRCVIWMDK